MNEYKVTMGAGWFDTKTLYVRAESAAAIQDKLEKELSYEIEFEGLRIKEITRI